MQSFKIKNNDFIIKDYSLDDFKKTCVIELFVVLDMGELKKTGYLSVIITSSNLVAHDSFIEPRFRRNGLGSKMYDYAENLLNKKIIPYEQYSGEKSSIDAVQFWKKRTGIILQDRHLIYED